MTPRNAICIVVDGLRASALGTYGNTWYGTPSLDRFAGQSIVVEWMRTSAPNLAAFYRSVWEGEHALRPAGLLESVPLPLQLAMAGIQQTLVTDDLWLDDHASRIAVEQHLWDAHWLDTETNRPASTIADTALGRVFAAAIERFEAWSGQGNLLWVHARGMQGPWDAPEGLRWELSEEGESRPPAWVIPPERELGDDPDQWLGVRLAYAAQIMVLDACFGALLAALDEIGDPTLVILAGSRGFALGEHGCAGSACRDLHGELLHVPWLLRLPVALAGPPPRYTGLAGPPDLSATLLDWFGLQSSGDGQSLLDCHSQDYSCLRQVDIAGDGEDQWLVRTPAWTLRHLAGNYDSPRPPQLYVKPDDRWEVNDVANRCPHITEGLLAVLAEWRRRASASSPLGLFDLDSELITPKR